jgi:hypothetical protein
MVIVKSKKRPTQRSQNWLQGDLQPYETEKATYPATTSVPFR